MRIVGGTIVLSVNVFDGNMPRRRQDLRVLPYLVENGRTSYTEIGRSIGISPAGVMKKVKALEGSGIIKGYTVILDHGKLGKPLSCVAVVKTKSSTDDLARDVISKFDTVLSIEEVLDKTVVMRFVCDMNDLLSISDFLSRREDVVSFSLSPVIRTYINRISVIPRSRVGEGEERQG